MKDAICYQFMNNCRQDIKSYLRMQATFETYEEVSKAAKLGEQ